MYIKCRLYQFPNTQRYVRGSHQLLPVVHLFSSQLLSGCGPPSGSVCGSGPGFQSVRKLPGHHRGADHSQPLPEQLYIWYVINQVVCLSVHLSFSVSIYPLCVCLSFSVCLSLFELCLEETQLSVFIMEVDVCHFKQTYTSLEENIKTPCACRMLTRMELGGRELIYYQYKLKKSHKSSAPYQIYLLLRGCSSLCAFVYFVNGNIK